MVYEVLSSRLSESSHLMRRTGTRILTAAGFLKKPSPASPPEETKRILIYHTHTHEAYEQVSEDPYEALEAWRTTDVDHSVVRVGEELAQALRQHGFRVTHDITDHEGEALSTAYTRSLKTLESYDETFDLYIDLHRDAYVSGAELARRLSVSRNP